MILLLATLLSLALETFEFLNKIKLKYNLNEYSFSILAFVIPIYPKLIPFSIAICFLTSLLDFSFSIKKIKIYLPLLLYFFVILLGFFLSSNIEKYFFEVELNLSFLMIPLALIFSKTSLFLIRNKIFISFVEGLLISILLSFFSLLVNINSIQSIEDVLYNNLSVFYHPSYMSMYFTFGILILWNSKINKETFFSKRITNILLIIFSFYVILLMSKTALLLLVFIHLYCGFVWMHKTKIWKSFALAFTLGITFFIIGYSSSTYVQNRIDNVFEMSSKDNSGSTGMRIIAWNASLKLIKQNPVLGCGVGDFEDELSLDYMRNKNYKMAKSKINAHNQYLQTTGKSGVVGLLSLLLIFYVVIVKNKSRISILFLWIIGFNFITESILQTQAGIVFFVFFISLFSSKEKEGVFEPKITKVSIE